MKKLIIKIGISIILIITFLIPPLSMAASLSNGGSSDPKQEDSSSGSSSNNPWTKIIEQYGDKEQEFFDKSNTLYLKTLQQTVELALNSLENANISNKDEVRRKLSSIKDKIVYALNVSKPMEQGQAGVSTVEDPLTKYDEYNPSKGTTSDTKIAEIGGTILATIQAIGTVVAVIAIIVIGLRYMTGSVQEKANYKETMIPYIIGAIMLFTITTVLQIVYNLVIELPN